MTDRRRIRVSGPLDLGATLGALINGRGDPTTWSRGDEVWRATQTPEGPATIHLRRIDATLEVEAWGPGRGWALEQAPALAGCGDDRSEFRPDLHAAVAELDRRLPGLRLGRTDRLVDALVPIVIGQKVTGAESGASYRRLVHTFGGRAPGPTPAPLHHPPGVDELASLGYADFHHCGIERRRADCLLRVCRRAANLEALLGLPSAEMGTRLGAIPGIGPWTVGLARLLVRGDPDAVPVGDYNLPSLVAWSFAGERRADDSRMLELLEPFAGHRGRVLRLVETGARRPPRRAPRRPIRSFARY